MNLLKGFEKKLFTAEECPVPMNIIEMYLKILTPIYLLNIRLQSNEATIGELIPSLIKVDHKLSNMAGLSQSGNLLSRHLRNEIKHRFDYELKSPIYRVKFYF